MPHTEGSTLCLVRRGECNQADQDAGLPECSEHGPCSTKREKIFPRIKKIFLAILTVCTSPPSPTHLLHSAEVIGEVWHEMCPSVGSHEQPHSTEIGPGIAGHQRVTDAADHLGETNQSLSELLIGQKAVALQDGRLNIAMGG